jgi:hypothetical protein
MYHVLLTTASPEALLYLSFLASPLCIVYLWGKRLVMLTTSTEKKHGWRQTVLLAAQVMVTAAVILVWYGLGSPLNGPEENSLRQFFGPSVALAIAAMAGSLLGTGTGKAVTAASSVLVMVNWLAVAIFQ